jgi:hypothetical protein
MVYLDRDADPDEIARQLWRELGPQLCLEIAATIAMRSSKAIVLELTKESESECLLT